MYFSEQFNLNWANKTLPRTHHHGPSPHHRVAALQERFAIEYTQAITHHRDTEDTEDAQRLEGCSLCLASHALSGVSVVNCTIPRTHLQSVLKFTNQSHCFSYSAKITKGRSED